MRVTIGRIATVLAGGAACAGCAGILGLDAGVADGPDADGDPALTDDASRTPESSRGDETTTAEATTAEATTAEATTAEATTAEATTAEAAGQPDHASGGAGDASAPDGPPDATCRTALQPCKVGTDCCSGTCGVSLTCL